MPRALNVNKDGLKNATKRDSLERAVKKSDIDTSRVKLLNDLGTELIKIGEYKNAVQYLQEANSLAKKLGYKSGMAKSYNKLGNAFWFQGDYESTLKQWLSAIKIWEEIGDKKGMSNEYSNVGLIYSSQKNFVKAFEYYAKGLRTAESIPDTKTMAHAYNNIGATYMRQSLAAPTDAESKSYLWLSLENHMKGRQLAEEINDKAGMASSYTNIGNVYYNLGLLADTEVEATSFYKKDLEFQENALKIEEEMGNKHGMGITYSSIAIVHNMMDNMPQVKVCLEKALALHQETGYKNGIKESYLYLSQLAEETKDFKQALKYHKLYVSMKDSIFTEKSSNQLLEIETKYETEKKQQENEALAQKNQLLSQQSNIQDLKIKQGFYFIIGLTLLSILIFGIAFLLIRQSKMNSLHAKLEMEQKLLRSQMNPHFIFNAMVGIQNYIYKEEPEVAANYLSSIVNLMRSIIDNSKKEYVSLDSEISTLHHYLTLQQVRFSGKFNFIIHTDPKIETEEILIPPMMAQPFIENSIVHGIMQKTNGEGKIVIRFAVTDTHLSLEIEDNGIGRGKAKEFAKGDDEHLSIATNITVERLKILNRNAKLKSSMAISDRFDEQGLASGTRVAFMFPLMYV